MGFIPRVLRKLRNKTEHVVFFANKIVYALPPREGVQRNWGALKVRGLGLNQVVQGIFALVDEFKYFMHLMERRV